jgi:hypothetical protein
MNRTSDLPVPRHDPHRPERNAVPHMGHGSPSLAASRIATSIVECRVVKE